MQLEKITKKPIRRTSARSIGREFARALDFETVKAATLGYDEVVQNLRGVERHFLAQVPDPEYAREIKRRTAEQLLEQAILHGSSQAVCRARLNGAVKLGFTNIEREAHYRLLYAKGALARGHMRIARRTASEIATKLDRSLRKRKSLLAQQCLMFTQKFLQQLEDAGTPPSR